MRLDQNLERMRALPVLIIGGGISGLASAWFLQQRGVPVVVLESRAYPGGNLLTTQENGFLVEHGPNSTLQKPGFPEDALGRLIEQLDLGKRLQVANAVASKRFILRQRQLMALPTSPPGFMLTRAFSLAAKLRLLAEPFIRRANHEESIADFTRRRLGQEFLDYAIDPFISGVYAGDPAALSVQAATPKIYELEQRYGSLIRGAIALGKIAKGAGMPRGRMISFEGGMQTLPRTLVEKLPPRSVHYNATVNHLAPALDDYWQVGWTDEFGEQSVLARDVLLSLPAPAAASLLAPFAAPASRLVQDIPYAPIASVGLGYRRAQVAHPLDGFGFLVPRKEGVRTLGGLFSSTLFPGRAPDDHLLLTAFIGGMRDQEVLAMDDTSIAKQVEKDLSSCLGIRRKWDFLMLTRYKRAIPQYGLGHLNRMAELDTILSRFPGLYICANWRGGISVADCVKNAEKIAKRIADAAEYP